jgi:gamma-glutamyltranspeptidase / glutathione hydrolase
MAKYDRCSSPAWRRKAAVSRYGERFALTLVVSMSLMGGGRVEGAPRPTGSLAGGPLATRSEVIAQNGMAATSQPLATQIAIDILKRGGSAVDAAIAANAALGLMEPTGCGIGGDLFALVWDAKSQKLYGLNGSGRSPKSLTLATLQGELKKLNRTTIPPRGALPVSVPGAVDGWFALHGRFGKLPMADVLAPAIGYARDGFPVSEVIAYYFERNARVLAEYPGFKETYMPGGNTPRKGDVFRNSGLAKTYSAIAAGGRDAFYRGEIPKIIEEYVRANGGFLSADDFAAHSSTWVEPISVKYRGYDVWQLPPNTQGLATLQILGILDGFDLRAMGYGSADFLHTFAEAKKLAFEDRAQFLADPEFAKIPVQQLLAPEYLAKRRGLISSQKAATEFAAGDVRLDKNDTIYLSVADRDGNMVSLIQSNYRGMGSGMTPTGLGFVLHNRGESFSLNPRDANAYAPGKRPFHTIIPGFVTKDGKPWLSFGVMGGAMQPQGQAQVLINMLDFGMNLQEAGDAPRIRHDGSSEPTGERMKDGGTVVLEPGFSDAAVKALEARGHKAKVSSDGDFGGYQAILRDPVTGVYYGASESRKDGQAQGY